jgi:hypothetical protein
MHNLAIMIPRNEVAPVAAALCLLSTIPFAVLVPVDLLTQIYAPGIFAEAPHPYFHRAVLSSPHFPFFLRAVLSSPCCPFFSALSFLLFTFTVLSFLLRAFLSSSALSFLPPCCPSPPYQPPSMSSPPLSMCPLCSSLPCCLLVFISSGRE